MRYHVRLSQRALRDIEAIYDLIRAQESARAFEWFHALLKTVYSLERFPERGTPSPDNPKLYNLFFSKKPSVYRIIYAVDKRGHAVNVIHIRHGARH